MEYLGIKLYVSNKPKYDNWHFYHVNEFWKDVPNYEGKYSVSSLGRVKNIKWKRLLRPFDRKIGTKEEGYKTVHLGSYHLGKRIINYTVHSLVMLCFVGERPIALPMIHHKNFNKSNNWLINLEYCTQSHNRKQDFIFGNMSYLGEKNNMAKINASQALEILSLKTKLSYSKIAKIYGLTVSGVSSIINGYTWSHVTAINKK